MPTDVQIVNQSWVSGLVVVGPVLRSYFFPKRGGANTLSLADGGARMVRKWLSIFWLATVALAFGESPPGILVDSSFLRLLNKHSSGSPAPRNQWTHRPPEDSYRQASEGISRGYTSYPFGSTLKAMESSSEQAGSSASSQDYWKPSSANSNFTSGSYYGYSRPVLTSANGASGPSYQESIQGSHSLYQYQHARPSVPSYAAVKKSPTYFLKGKLQVQSFDAPGKPKYKKTVSQQSPSSYKKTVYPRVHKPYAKHKYPTQKIVHPLYRRYYQSPYQRYAISSNEMLRYRSKPRPDGYYKESVASPTSASEKHHTTERMDDAYPDGSVTSEDYSGFNDTRSKIGTSYYDAYEEVERTTSEPEESSYDETTTRGYYGDRIYMSTQVPLVSSAKAPTKNKFFIVRRTSHDDEDIETIFE